MHNRLFIVNLLLLVLLSFNPLKAREHIHPVSVSVMNQSWAFPFSELTRIDPVYPGLSAGIYRLNPDRIISFPQSLNLGYFYNPNAGSATYLYVDQAARLALRCGFFAEFSAGLGYFHAFHPRPVYTRNENNSYSKTRDWGKPGLMFSFSQTIGFDLQPKFGHRIAPFIRNQWIASTPYFDMVIPIRPTNLTQLGTMIYF